MMKCAKKVGVVLSDSFLVNPERLSTAPDHTLRHGLKVIQAELWVRHWYNKAQLYKTHNKAIIAFRGSYTIITLIRDNPVAPLMGWAKCSPTDAKSDRIGIAVATARAFGEKIPDYI